VSLRAFHSERQAVEGSGLEYQRILNKWWHPEDEDMRRFLEIATDPTKQPVYVHCKLGADRTGVAVAVYRVCVEGWTKEDANRGDDDGGLPFPFQLAAPRALRPRPGHGTRVLGCSAWGGRIEAVSPGFDEWPDE
jgi:hypothetical protein